MKKVISIFLHTLCLLLTLTACGSANKAPDIDTGTPKTSQELADIRDTIGVSEPVKTGSGMDEKELLASLNGSAAFFECFAPDAEFVAAEIQINQRNTEKKQSDEIYATVTSVNKCSSYTTEFHWTYKYYSEGGWRMEALSQNGPGTYTINYWPQEEDLRTVWNDIYSEKYRNGQLEVCETERTGDDFVMFLVTYSVFSDIATEYAKTEVRFRFEDGRWITDSMSYPVDSTYEFNAEVYGMYLGTRLYDTSMTVYIMNLYPKDSKLHIDWYKYTVDTQNYEFYSVLKENQQGSFDLYSVGTIYGEMSLENQVWRCDSAQMDRQNNHPIGPLQEADALTIIQQTVEANNFPYWTDQATAKFEQGMDELRLLEKDVDLALYRQACVDYYSQLGIEFPDTLDPCMYTAYLTLFNLYTPDAPDPVDYMDEYAYNRIVHIFNNYVCFAYDDVRYGR